MSKFRKSNKTAFMLDNKGKKLWDGAACTVVKGTHKGKSGVVRDIHKSKTGHVTITVVQNTGVRFKTLGKNVELV